MFTCSCIEPDNADTSGSTTVLPTFAEDVANNKLMAPYE
jgi:hypothetical protein